MIKSKPQSNYNVCVYDALFHLRLKQPSRFFSSTTIDTYMLDSLNSVFILHLVKYQEIGKLL